LDEDVEAQLERRRLLKTPKATPQPQLLMDCDGVLIEDGIICPITIRLSCVRAPRLD